MKGLFKRLFREEEGQGLVEYALIIGLVAIALIVGLQTLAGKGTDKGITGIFKSIGDSLDTAR